MTFAAKYYALISAYTALNSSDESISRYASAALIEVASSDYRQGAFCGYFEFSDVGLHAFLTFTREQSPPDIISEIERTVYHSTLIRIISEHLAPDFLNFVNEKISNWEGLREYFDEMVPLAEKEWKNVTLSKLWQDLQNQLLGRPFSDVGKERNARFGMLFTA